MVGLVKTTAIRAERAGEVAGKGNPPGMGGGDQTVEAAGHQGDGRQRWRRQMRQNVSQNLYEIELVRDKQWILDDIPLGSVWRDTCG